MRVSQSCHRCRIDGTVPCTSSAHAGIRVSGPCMSSVISGSNGLRPSATIVTLTDTTSSISLTDDSLWLALQSREKLQVARVGLCKYRSSRPRLNSRARAGETLRRRIHSHMTHWISKVHPYDSSKSTLGNSMETKSIAEFAMPPRLTRTHAYLMSGVQRPLNTNAGSS